MHDSGRAGLLLAGDILVFYVSLWLALALRYLELPSGEQLMTHVVPFTVLFAVWVVVFHIAGLYAQRTLLFREALPGLVLRAQTINVVIAALFFFAIPAFGITPKTILAIYLVVSLVLIVLWRLNVASHVGFTRPQNALLIGEGREVDELLAEVREHPDLGITVVLAAAVSDIEHSSALQEQLHSYVRKNRISMVIADSRDERLADLMPIFFNLSFRHHTLSFVDFVTLYESVFRRVPLSALRESWFLEHVQVVPRGGYDTFHRVLDLAVSLALAPLALGAHVLVALAIKLDDGGPVLFVHERIGQWQRPIRVIKYRSMSTERREEVTRVGRFLRATRIDELPQLWSIFRGDLSLIGPRPELPHLVDAYAESIPYYRVRHLIKPGLTGWAQINEFDVPRRAQVETEKTMLKLSYDLYYLKHRSFFLDLTIALRTIHTVLSRTGT